MASSNTRWQAPLLQWYLHSLKQQCWDMLCLPSHIPSLDWVLLPTKDAPLSLPRQQALSTIPMNIPFLQTGANKLARASGTSLSLRRSQPPLALASITTPLETILSPPPCAQSQSVGNRRPLPARVLTPPPVQPHSSQGILATSSTGVACAVYISTSQPRL
jgi:hypothetical protein